MSKPTLKVVITRGKPFKSLMVGAYAKNHYTVEVSDGMRKVTDKIAADRTSAMAHAAGLVSGMLGVARQWDLGAMAAAAGFELEYTSKAVR